MRNIQEEQNERNENENFNRSKFKMNGYQIAFCVLVCTVPPSIYLSHSYLSPSFKCEKLPQIAPYAWNSQQIILFWTNFFDESISPCSLENNQIFHRPNKCQAEYPNCVVTSNHNMRNHSQAFIFHHRDINNQDTPFECSLNSSKPLCVLFNMEAPNNVNNLTDRIHYHLTANYQLDSDIHVPYGYVEKRIIPLSEDAIKRDVSVINKTKSVAWIVSNCKTESKREDYVKELQEYIDVDIYGDCGPGLKCSRSNNQDCLKTIANKYYFYLSFENTFSKDYATEKIFKIQNFSIVPIVYGGANYSQLLPPNSYIDATRLTPQQLADKMKHLISNKKEYKKYFDWKRFYTSRENSVIDELLCKTCQLIQNIQNSPNKTIFPSKTGEDFNHWYHTRNTPKAHYLRTLFICLLIICCFSFVYWYHRRKLHNLWTSQLHRLSAHV